MKHFFHMMAVSLTVSACANFSFSSVSNDATPNVSPAPESASDVAAPTTASEVAAPTAQAASSIKSSVSKNNIKKTDDDIKVLPVTPPKSAQPNKKNDEKSQKVAPTKMNVILRQSPKDTSHTTPAGKTTISKTKSLPPKTKKVVKLPPPPPPKPVLTRGQILQKEIDRERNALKAAQRQLEQAKKRGNAKTIAKLNAAIRDRELNIRAIEAEIRK